MTQAQKLEQAKAKTLARFGGLMSDFDQCDDYKWASLEEVDGDEVWTIVSITAKKSFDPDEAFEEYEFKKKRREEKVLKKEKKS